MSQQVLQPGFDPTSLPGLTGAEIGQLITQATFSTSIGGVITTLDDAGGVPSVPNPVVDTTLTTFIWVRVGYPTSSGVFVTAYLWNPNSANPTNPSQLLNWNSVTSASIGPGELQGFQIAANTITADKLTGGISASQVVGLSALMLNALTSQSSPVPGAITGSFGTGFTLGVNALNSINQIANGILNQSNKFSGTPILPGFIDTTLGSPAANSVVMALNGTGQPASWVLKAILNMPEPDNQAGYIPVARADNSIHWTTPTAAFPAGSISAVAEIQGGQSITVTAVAATTNSWTLSTAATGTLIAGQTYVTIAGMGTKYANLNGTWLVTTVTTNASFVVVTSGIIAGSGTTTIGTVKYCNYIGTSNLNVGSSPTIVDAGTQSVTYNGVGLYTIYFTTPKGSASYLVLAQASDSNSMANAVFVRVIAKNTNYVQVLVYNLAAGSAGMSAIDSADVSVIVL